MKAEEKSSLTKTGKPRRYKRPANPREGILTEEWAYAACAIDGEGTLTINRQHQRNGRPRYGAVVEVFNTNPLFTDWFVQTFGGAVYSYGSRDPRWKRQNQWVLSGGSADYFLVGILPYLKLKRVQAQILRDLIALRKRAPHRISDDELQQRHALYEQVQALNRRGPPASTEREEALTG